MNSRTYRERLKKCSSLLEKEGLDVLLLAKPANMFYLAGDGRLCSFAMITQDGKVARLQISGTKMKYFLE